MTTKRTLAPIIREKDIQDAILDLLKAEGIWHERRNTGAMVGTYKGKSRFTRFGKPGVADIMCTPIHRKLLIPIMLWIECKRPGEKQTESQVNFQYEVEAAGHAYIVADSVDIVRDWLKLHR